MITRLAVPAVFLLTVVLQGCAGPSRLPAVPSELQGKAAIPGLSGVRYRPGFEVDKIIEEGKESLRRELAWRAGQGLSGSMPPSHFLAISGGGEK